LGSRRLQHLLHRVELLGLRQVAVVTGVEDERELRRERVDSVDGGLERTDDVGIRGLVEAHVAVARTTRRERRLRTFLRY
jgi:hypothetical protein